MNGILLVDKPILYTSHDMVDAVRRKIGMRRVGHAGTLDPLATGLMVILMGEYTRFFEKLSTDDKHYEGILTLGMRTNTQDLEGKILEWQDTRHLKDSQIQSAFASFKGMQEQEIPQFASAKTAGTPYYTMARRQVVFERRLKKIEVKDIHVDHVELPDVYFSVHVSKGTYVRTLCDDIGQKLGTGGTLSALRRTQSGRFSVNQSIPLDLIRNLPLEKLRERFLSIEK